MTTYYKAFAATRSYGLYQCDSLLLNDDSHPIWEHKGQYMGIKQFSWKRSDPIAVQVCIGYAQYIYMRRPDVTGDNWVQVITPAQIQALIGSVGLPHPSWVEYNDIYDGHIYILCSADSSIYFLKSTDYGASWSATEVISDWLTYGSGGMSISYVTSVYHSAGDVIWIGYVRGLSARSYLACSEDQGATWTESGILGIPNWKPTPFADPLSANICYSSTGMYKVDGDFIHLTRFYDYLGGDPPGSPVLLKYSDEIPNGYWFTASRGLWIGYDPDDEFLAQNIYIPHGKDLFSSHNAGATWHLVRQNYILGPIWGDNATNQVLVGTPGSGNPSEPHTVFSSANDFYTLHKKAGENAQIRGVGAIPYDCGGIALQGIALFGGGDTPEEEPVEPPGGWPVYFRAVCRELRADPAWDRLYIGAKTAWPAPYWNIPLTYQFVFSGSQPGLIFVPTLISGNSWYARNNFVYSGYENAYIASPEAHSVLVAGYFDDNAQVYFKPDVTDPPGFLSGWVLVGQFGSEYATSIDFSDYDLYDITVTHSDLVMPESNTIPSGVYWYGEGTYSDPWTWETIQPTPFTVNRQLRELSLVWAGAKGNSEACTIKRSSITLSGWTNRCGGLPENIQINDITRGF